MESLEGITPMSGDSDSESRGSMRRDRSFLSRTVFLAIPRLFLASIVVMMLGVITWMALQYAGVSSFVDLNASTRSIVFHDYANVMLIMTVLGFLAYPLLAMLPSTRRAWRLVHGYGILHLDEKLGIPGHKVRAWLRSAGYGIGIGVLIVIITTIISLIGEWSGISSSSSSTTTTMAASALESLIYNNGNYRIQCLLLISCVVVIGPICEEFLFRGVIGMSLRDSGMFQNAGGRTRMALVCALSGMLFGIMHVQTSASIAVSVATVIQAGIIGALFTWMAAYRFHSLVPSMFAHMTNNILTLIVILSFGIGA